MLFGQTSDFSGVGILHAIDRTMPRSMRCSRILAIVFSPFFHLTPMMAHPLHLSLESGSELFILGRSQHLFDLQKGFDTIHHQVLLQHTYLINLRGNRTHVNILGIRVPKSTISTRTSAPFLIMLFRYSISRGRRRFTWASERSTGWAGEIAGLIEHSLLCLNVSGYLTDWDAIEQILDCSTDPFLTIPFGQHEDI